MGVAHAHHVQRAGPGGCAQHRCQRGAGVGSGGRHVAHVDRVEGVLESAQQVGAARVVGRKRAHHVVGHLGVEQQAEHVVVAQRQVGALHPVDRVGRGGVERTHRRRLEATEEPGVAGCLDVEGERPGADMGQRHAGAPRVHALQRLAVQPHQSLGLEAGPVVVEAEVDDSLELAAHPVGRYVDGAAEPGGAPRSAPRAPHRERFVVLGHCLVVGDRFARRVPGLDRERHGAVVQVRQHPLPQFAFDPLLDDHPVVVHPRILRDPRSTEVGRTPRRRLRSCGLGRDPASQRPQELGTQPVCTVLATFRSPPMSS